MQMVLRVNQTNLGKMRRIPKQPLSAGQNVA